MSWADRLGSALDTTEKELHDTSWNAAADVRAACLALELDPLIASPMVHIHNYCRLVGPVFDLSPEELSELSAVLEALRHEAAETEEPDMESLFDEQVDGFKRMFLDEAYRTRMLAVYQGQILPWISAQA